MRFAVWLGALLGALLVVAPTWAEEQEPEVKTIAPQAIEVASPATALARGRAGEEILLATGDGAVLRHEIGRGVTWRGKTGGEAAYALVAAPVGHHLAAATPTELLGFGAKEGGALWRTQRPVAFAFDASGRRLVTLTSEGEVVERDAATGVEVARRRFEEQRRVVLASLHVASGLAVLGVADG